MASATSTPGLFGFFRFAVVPIGSEAERAFLQQRVALYLKLLAGLVAAPLVTSPILIRYAIPGRSDLLLHPARFIHLGIGLGLLAIWAFFRKGQRSLDQLYGVDAVVTTSMGVAIILMLRWMPLDQRPEFGVALATTYTLVGRAALIPSTWLRTLVLGFKTMLAATVGTYLLIRYAPDAASAPRPINGVFVVIFWGLLALGVTTMISRVIYGLSERVREVVRLGQYTLEEKIGEGGMGAVYRASHAMLRRPTAVKLLPPDKAGDTTIARFEREVQITSGLTHPNTIAIYDFGRTPDGVFYYAMEYLEGLTVEGLVRLDGAQPPGRTIDVLQQVAGALAEAHDKGIVHRDVKPANIILCERGGQPDVAKVVDFGLVKDLKAPEDGALSNVNTITGTPLYLSPEAIKSPEAVSAKSDLYALGAVGYYLITGEHVFDFPSVVEVCSHHLHVPPTPPSERLGRPLPPDLEAILMQCLEKDPEDRPASAEAVHDALLACADASEWSVPKAKAWWRANRAGVSEAVSLRGGEKSETGAFAPTIAVDLRGRAAPR